MGTQGGGSEMESRLAPGLFRESGADAICEVAGLWSKVCSSTGGGVTAGLAGLASAGEERADVHSSLATEMALPSVVASVAKLGFAVVKQEGGDVGMEAGGFVSGTSGKLPSSSSSSWLTSMAASSESEAEITNGFDHHTASGSPEKQNITKKKTRIIMSQE